MRRASASLSPYLLKWSGNEQRRVEGGEIDGKGERDDFRFRTIRISLFRTQLGSVVNNGVSWFQIAMKHSLIRKQ